MSECSDWAMNLAGPLTIFALLAGGGILAWGVNSGSCKICESESESESENKELEKDAG